MFVEWRMERTMEERKAIREFARRAARDPKMRGLLEAMTKNGPLDMNSTEPIVVACVVWGTHLIDNCREDQCACCRVPVSLAPSTQQLAAEYKGPVVYSCLKCMEEGRPEKMFPSGQA